MQQPRIAREFSRHVLRTVRTLQPIVVKNALVHNRVKEPLSSSHPNEFKWYSCGPTVYDDAHLGHARTYVCLDTIRRIITSLTRTRVHYAMGITDIDDKILQRSNELAVSPLDIAAQFEQRFFEDMDALNVQTPTAILRVSEHIPELQQFISDLIASGAAYKSKQGNVYFAVQSSGERYSQLDPSRALTTNCHHVHNVKLNADILSEKRDARDFALWKRAGVESQLKDGTWDSPWGRGRPGWHVECSAMAMACLGPHLDLHTGGMDLRFPHHTNELATAEAKLFNEHRVCAQHPTHFERWSHTWLHVGHLRIAGLKMSKSLKNFVKVRDFFERGGDADSFRAFSLLHKYSSAVEYSEDRLKDAQFFIRRIRGFLARQPNSSEILARDATGRKLLSMHPRCATATKLHSEIRTARDEIEAALADNFDTPCTMSKISKLMTAANSSMTNEGEWISGPAALAYGSACEMMKETLEMLGFSKNVTCGVSRQGNSGTGKEDSSKVIEAYVQLRARVRAAANKNDVDSILRVCDESRDVAFNDLGVRIADKKDGSSSWNRN